MTDVCTRCEPKSGDDPIIEVLQPALYIIESPGVISLGLLNIS